MLLRAAEPVVAYRSSSAGGGAERMAHPPEPPPSWHLSEETMPESVLHDQAVELLRALLLDWIARLPQGSSAASLAPPAVVRNLAFRFREDRPTVGIDPDLAILSPPPPDLARLRSVRTWLPGHLPPVLAIEVVSDSDARKDDEDAPAKYDASGTRELWVIDPLLAGPSSLGPHLVQIWRRSDAGRFERIHAGGAPAWSPEVGAYLVVPPGSQLVHLSDDAAGERLWRTEAQRERAARLRERAEKERVQAEKEREREAKERERAEKEAALALVAELQAQLRARR